MGSKLGFGGERKLEDVGVSFALMTIIQCTVAFVSIIIYMYVCIHVDIYIYLRGTLFTLRYITFVRRPVIMSDETPFKLFTVLSKAKKKPLNLLRFSQLVLQLHDKM